jgi:hypothetical protein
MFVRVAKTVLNLPLSRVWVRKASYKLCNVCMLEAETWPTKKRSRSVPSQISEHRAFTTASLPMYHQDGHPRVRWNDNTAALGW